jgi:amino acid transporter
MDRGFGPVSLGPARAFAPDVVAATGAHLRAASLAADDPCVADPSLVCLGLLFGIGDFSDAGAEVLGALALTGIGILLVLAVAGGLLLLGSTALVVSVRVRPRTVAA